MCQPNPSSYDVVIAGAGPVGLFLACELRLADLSVLVLEQAAEPSSPLKCLPFGMRGLSAPTLDAFYRRGLLNDVAEGAARDRVASAAHWSRQVRRPGGHFAGIQFFLDNVDSSKWPYHLPGPGGTTLAIEMQRLESILADRALSMGAEVRRSQGVDGFDQTDDDVTVYAGDDTFRASWLVGCDGGRSTVRKAGDFAFVGTEPEFTGYSVQVDLADPELLSAGRHYTATGMYTYQPPGTIALVDFDGGVFHRTHPISVEHVQEVLRRISGTGVTVKGLQQATTWTDRAFLATTYRKGRVLLAGDAAHIHSPLGGQGLNLGLGDAMNLGWKLAATHRGVAPAGLLDTYTTERQPVAAQILDWSRAQVALMRPTQSSRALEAVIRDLINTRDGATYFAERIWGISLRYDLDGHHPLVGRSCPDLELADGTRVGVLMEAGNGVLLDLDGRPQLEALARRWGGRLDYVAQDAKDRLGLSAVLVRPDGFVAWATDSTPDVEQLTQSLSRWFGGPE
ncbi:MAG: FAD-dependent monooxygenase [Stenotrophomonas sp.]|uniref:FAD-dependent monooxygenase n=1 Tax=Stenotrophomonas sp. TaxID=69392 RepID=UPI003D6D8E4F